MKVLSLKLRNTTFGTGHLSFPGLPSPPPPPSWAKKGGIFYGTTNPKIRFVTEKLKSDFTRLSDCGASGGGVPNLPRTCPCMEDPTIIYYMKSRRSYASSFPHNFRL